MSIPFVVFPIIFFFIRLSVSYSLALVVVLESNVYVFVI